MDTAGERWALGRRAALDGLRGLAVLLVVASHAGFTPPSAGGVVGVTVFFTLSGFLITALLLAERDRGGVRVGKFYERRARRLLPALFAMLAAVSVLSLAMGMRTADVARGLVPTALYYGNWERATGEHLANWSHTWSLAVEEQFYLLFPLLLIAARRHLVAACWLGVGWAVVGRLVLWDGGAGLDRVYYGTDMHIDALLVGALLATWMHGRSERDSHPRVALVLVAALVALAFVGGDLAIFVGLPTLVPILAAGVLWCTAQGAGSRLLSWRPLTYVGGRSYAIYLWHYPLLVMFGSEVASALNVVLVVVTLAVAEASWRWVETPFRSQVPTERARRALPAARRRVVASATRTS